jgi:Peptidase_C39 like family
MRLRSCRLVITLVLTGFSVGAQELSPAPAPLDGILLRPNVWELGRQDLEADLMSLRFEWISANQEVARSSSPGLAFHKHSLSEAILSFRNGKLAEARLSYFNRGDSGALREDQFEALIASITKDLSEATGRQPAERGRDAGSAVKADGRVWQANGSRYLLEWSATKGSNLRAVPFRAEFIRLTIRRDMSAPVPIGTAPARSRDIVKRFVGRDHVECVAGDDVKIKNLPMVDQGEKCYCVVASVERVLRYYGATVDQHELAQVAHSDAARGTSTGAMLASLRRLTARLGIKVRSLYEWNARDFLKVIDDYNRATKRGKLAPEVTIPAYATDADEFFSQVNPQIYKAVRLKSTADFGRFQRDIQRNIDEGVPLLWSVRLGIVKEHNAPQAASGHMRIITGYNNTTGEVLYSDSWGSGHEEKRMALDDAWTITNGVNSLQPLS